MSFFKFWAKPEPKPAAKKAAANPASVAARQAFHAVEIKSGHDCCQAAKSVEGQRFLSRGASPPPSVPMADCDRKMQCQCRYIHYDDRRTEVRRNVWGASFATDHGNQHFAAIRGADKVRKEKRGRRKDD